MDYLPYFLKYYNVDLQPTNSNCIDIELAKDLLYPGAHIATSNPYEHYHHGIVIDTNTPDISIIHLWGADKDSSRVQTTTLPIFIAGSIDAVGKNLRHLYLVNYDGDTVEKQQTTVEIAKNMLENADDIKYNLATSNCEGFACFCRTLKWHSEQIEKLTNILIENAADIYEKVKDADENNRRDIFSLLQAGPIDALDPSQKELYGDFREKYN
ncbi:unnamed protein product [Adineta steineri]|uniref:LRAT domain-containing protein n=1 Tax=Adineta steineri TaxID=433720 RepID=A0A813P2X0_9BILA|nr:unnamed protein product [Adineta steineri]CAF0747423.1 unnamed protein product [Adineta steineri]